MSVPEIDTRSALEQSQLEAAKARVAEQGDERARRIALLDEPGGIGRADTPDRVAARLDRLSRYWARAPRPGGVETVLRAPAEEVVDAAIKRGMAWGEPPSEPPLEAAGAVLEKIVGTADFVGINYLETGVIASRAVGRVNVGNAAGHVVAYGTGSLVAPRVLLTNHHVLPDAETARTSAIEFDFEDGPDGQPRQSHRFPLAPDALFYADEGLDFAIVAVDPGSGSADALATYGYNPIIEAEGKAIVGEFVTIIQHPKGERKQVALRENRIVDVLENFLHYETDTEPGSSGSLVFNDQWETVALHHAGVPDPNRQATGGFINEGIRISRILGRLGELSAGAPANPLLEPVLKPTGDRPVEVATAPSAVPDLEKIEIDPDYSSRKGFDPDFLGSGKRSVPLPELSPELIAKAAIRTDGDKNGAAYILPYHHFSLAMNKERKLAFFTAVNIDGALSQRPPREEDKWAFDPRIPSGEQTGELFYLESKELDRGHLVRRLDPAWGDSAVVVKAAIDDTFHFTNCSPQHEKFNRSATMWAGVEEYALEHADNENFKVNVFSGPVFAEDDDEYCGVKLPRQFWKVLVMAKTPGLLSATAYLLSQESLIKGLEEAAVEFSYGAYRTFQVQVAEIERLTGLSFESLPDFDPLGSREASRIVPREVANESAVVL